MLRLIATFILLSICFHLGLMQQNTSAKTVIAVSMRRADKAMTTSKRTHSSTLPQATHVTLNANMIFPDPTNTPQCLTVGTGAPAAPSNLLLESCYNDNNQYWHYDTGTSQWQLQREQNYCLATVQNHPSPEGRVTIGSCDDNRARMLLPHPKLSNSFFISGTTYVLNSDTYGYITVSQQDGWSQ